LRSDNRGRLSTNGIQQMTVGLPVCRDPGAIVWSYSRSETIADLTVHVVGLCFGYLAASVLLAFAAVYAATVHLVAASIYAAGLVSMLTFSAAYNLWPVSPMKWLLRRFDHSAIYGLIAATYPPFVLALKNGAIAVSILIGVWCTATVGIAAKLALPGRFDRFSIGVYLVIGWSAVAFCSDSAIPTTAVRFMVAGGALFTIGVIFHIWQTLRFQNAIWHCFVLLGVICHYAAAFNLLLN
jgi:hemolysin III